MQRVIEMFKAVNINVPLIDALRDIPGYMKFLKNAVMKKRRFDKSEVINLTEECSAILQNRLPAKRKDPGSFTLTCEMGGEKFSKVLCDLGASINLMPFSIFEKLNLKLKPTDISLVMADRSTCHPQGIVENVFIKIKHLTFPADFVVLKMPEVKEQQLILGRPFLATGRALIDVQEGELTFRVDDQVLKLSIYDALKGEGDDKDCFSIHEECIDRRKPPDPHEVDKGGMMLRVATVRVGENPRSGHYHHVIPP